VSMANVLSEEKKQQVLALGRLGWPLRKIQRATRIRRETASQYLKAAGIAVRPPGGWGRRAPKPANEVITDSEAITHLNPSSNETKWALFPRSKWHLRSRCARTIRRFSCLPS
jgi:hypothetical protein